MSNKVPILLETVGKIVVQPSTGFVGEVRSIQVGYGRKPMISVRFLSGYQQEDAWFDTSVWRLASPLESLAAQDL